MLYNVTVIISEERAGPLDERLLPPLTHRYCTYTVYGILMLGINVMPSNYFLSHFILSAIELPSNILGWVMTDYLGRRVTFWVTFVLTAIFCAAAPFCTHSKYGSASRPGSSCGSIMVRLFHLDTVSAYKWEHRE